MCGVGKKANDDVEDMILKRRKENIMKNYLPSCSRSSGSAVPKSVTKSPTSSRGDRKFCALGSVMSAVVGYTLLLGYNWLRFAFYMIGVWVVESRHVLGPQSGGTTGAALGQDPPACRVRPGRRPGSGLRQQPIFGRFPGVALVGYLGY